MTEIDNHTAVSGRKAVMSHQDWMSAAEREYRLLLEMFAGLAADDWHRPTDCDEWDVREVLAHLVGGALSTSSLRELRRLQKLGREFRPGVDGMNDVEVLERAELPPDRLLTDLAAAAERGVRARRRIPAAIRALRVPFGPPFGRALRRVSDGPRLYPGRMDAPCRQRVSGSSAGCRSWAGSSGRAWMA